MAKITLEQLLTVRNLDDSLELYTQAVLKTKHPAGMVDVVLDTDTYNEIDDQYALALLAASQDKFNICGITAAPFHNHHSESPGDGMRRSYQEIFKVLDLTEHQELSSRVFQGSDRFLTDEKKPVDSKGASELIPLAMEHSPTEPLYVACIAAPTNIASALLIEPAIRDRIVVVWCGGVGLDWPDALCFNGCQDIAASRVLLSSGVPLVMIPARGVGYAFSLSGIALEYWLRGRNKFCDYILTRTKEEARLEHTRAVWSRQIVDVLPIMWLMGDNFMLDRIDRRPNIGYDMQYSFDPRRPPIRYVYSVKRDNIANELLGRLGQITELLNSNQTSKN